MKKTVFASLTIVFAVIIAVIGSSGRGETTTKGETLIESVSFCREVGITLDLSEDVEMLGYIQVEYTGEDITEDSIFLFSENEDVATVSIDTMAVKLIRYKVTAVAEGSTNIIAASSSGDARSEKLSVTVIGGGSISADEENAEFSPETTVVEQVDSSESEATSIPTSTSALPVQTTAYASVEITTTVAETEPIVTEIAIEPQPEPTAPAETVATAEPDVQPSGNYYVLNTNSKKIHLPTCSSVKQMSEKNHATTGDIQWALSQGYVWCKRCGS